MTGAHRTRSWKREVDCNAPVGRKRDPSGRAPWSMLGPDHEGLMSINGASHPEVHPQTMDMLISIAWLSGHHSDPDVVVMDCGARSENTPERVAYRSGLEGSLFGHIPTAGFVDPKGNLSNQSRPIEFAPPSPEARPTDTLSAESYRREVADRAGRVPSAIDISGLDMIEETGRHTSLADRASVPDIARAPRISTYCRDEIAASSKAFALTRPGLKDVAGYVASLRGWAAHSYTPMTPTSSHST